MKKSTRKPKSGRKERWFSSDRPIDSAGADVLGRSAFAARLAQSIGAWDGRDSLVISLHGGWGTGKTSVKNMVLEKLRGSPTRCPQIVEFSPWQVSGTGTLVGAFFEELGIALGCGQESKSGLSKKLSSYAKRFALIGHVVKPLGTLVSFMEPRMGALITAGAVGVEQSAQTIQAGADAAKAGQDARAKGLADLKRDLGTIMASLPRPVLVVIDDIDRLTTEEILQVFQLVKVNADFPNLVYLLLFERSIVENALDQISGDRGREFLQKIVQVEFHVPHAHRKAIEKALVTGLDKFLEQDPIKPLFDQNLWRDLYLGGIANYFQNLRHVYRFLSSFGFHVANFKSGKSFEVNPVDLIGLETLRVFEPGLYEQLPSAKSLLTREEERGFFGRIQQDEIEAAVAQLLTHVPINRQAPAKTILGVLFPPISGAFDNDEGVSGQKQKWLREHRVCHFDLFDKFFSLAVGEGDLSQAEVDRLVSLTSDRNGFVAECRALLERGLLEVAFERLDAFKDTTPLAGMPALITALCDLCEDLPAPKTGLLARDLSNCAWRLIYFGLLRERDPQRRFEVLRDAFNNSSGVVVPVDIVNMEERTEARENREHEFLVGEGELGELKVLCVAKIRGIAAKREFRSHPDLRGLLSSWLNWGDRAEVRSWIREHVMGSLDAVWLLRRLLSVSTSSGAAGTRVLHHINLPFVEQFLDSAHLASLTDGLKVDDFQGLDRTALLEFRRAVKRRAQGRPDEDWRRPMSDLD